MCGSVQIMEAKTQNEDGDWSGAYMTMCSTSIPVGKQVHIRLFTALLGLIELKTEFGCL